MLIALSKRTGSNSDARPSPSGSLERRYPTGELIGRLGRRLRSEIVRVFGMTPEIALAHEFEASRLDLGAQSSMRWSETVAPAPGGCGMVRNHQMAAGLERRKQSGVHLGAIDPM
jgi:hypothetical protein